MKVGSSRSAAARREVGHPANASVLGPFEHSKNVVEAPRDSTLCPSVARPRLHSELPRKSRRAAGARGSQRQDVFTKGCAAIFAQCPHMPGARGCMEMGMKMRKPWRYLLVEVVDSPGALLQVGSEMSLS